MAEVFPRVGFICLQNGQVGRVFHTADLIIPPSANIFMVFWPCDFYWGRAGHVTLKLNAVAHCHCLWWQLHVKDWRVSWFCRVRERVGRRQDNKKSLDGNIQTAWHCLTVNVLFVLCNISSGLNHSTQSHWTLIKTEQRVSQPRTQHELTSYEANFNNWHLKLSQCGINFSKYLLISFALLDMM